MSESILKWPPPYKKRIISRKVNLVVWCDEDLKHFSSKVIAEKNNFSGTVIREICPFPLPPQALEPLNYGDMWPKITQDYSMFQNNLQGETMSSLLITESRV